MSTDWETHWSALLDHPAWQKLVELLRDERTAYLAELLQYASVSQDAKVAMVAQKILANDQFVRMPEEERVRDRARSASQSQRVG